MATEIDITELIMEVRKYTPLWSTDSNSYYRLNIKTERWFEIACKVLKLDPEKVIDTDKDINVEIVKKKWKSIRSNYRKKLRTTPLQDMDSYPNAKLLEFLLPMMKFSTERPLCHKKTQIKNIEGSGVVDTNHVNAESTEIVPSDSSNTNNYGHNPVMECGYLKNNSNSGNQLSTTSSISSILLENNNPQMVLDVLPRITFTKVNNFQPPQNMPTQNLVLQKNSPEKINPIKSQKPLSRRASTRSRLKKKNDSPYCIIPKTACSTSNLAIIHPLNTVQAQTPVLLICAQPNLCTQSLTSSNIQPNIKLTVNSTENGLGGTINTHPVLVKTHSSINTPNLVRKKRNFIYNTAAKSDRKQSPTYIYTEPKDSNDISLYINVPPQTESSDLINLQKIPVSTSPLTITSLTNTEPQIIGINAPYSQPTQEASLSSSPPIFVSLLNNIDPQSQIIDINSSCNQSMQEASVSSSPPTIVSLLDNNNSQPQIIGINSPYYQSPQEVLVSNSPPIYVSLPDNIDPEPQLIGILSPSNQSLQKDPITNSSPIFILDKIEPQPQIIRIDSLYNQSKPDAPVSSSQPTFVSLLDNINPQPQIIGKNCPYNQSSQEAPISSSSPILDSLLGNIVSQPEIIDNNSSYNQTPQDAAVSNSPSTFPFILDNIDPNSQLIDKNYPYNQTPQERLVSDSALEFASLLNDINLQSHINSSCIQEPYNSHLYNLDPNDQTTINHNLYNTTLSNQTPYTLTSQSSSDPQFTLSLATAMTPAYLESLSTYSTGITSVKSSLFSTNSNEPVILTFHDLIQDD